MSCLTVHVQHYLFSDPLFVTRFGVEVRREDPNEDYKFKTGFIKKKQL